MSFYYAGVGGRETPAHVLNLMTRIAQGLAKVGGILRSGGARGADTAFEAGAGSERFCTSASNVSHNSLFFTGPVVDRHPLRFHPGSHSVIPLITYCDGSNATPARWALWSDVARSS